MAEKADKNDDVNTLKRRGRRRLVGAIALVLLAVIVLPMVFDSEPRGTTPPPVSVRIPGEEESGFAPKVTPKAPLEKPVEKAVEKAPDKAPDKAPEKAQEKAPEKVPEKAEEKKEAPKVAEKKEAPKAENRPAPAPVDKPVAPSEAYFIPVAALATPEKLNDLLAKLKAAGLPHYTEPLATKSGTVTRVRVGPYASREAAEKALAQLKGLGLTPGKIATKS